MWPSSNSEYPTGSCTEVWGSAVGGWAVNANSEHLEDAVKLAEYCCKEASEYMNENGTKTNFVTDVEVAPQSELQAEIWKLYDEAVNKFQALNANSIDSSIVTELRTLDSGLVGGLYTVDEMLAKWSALYAENTYFD